MSQGLTAAALSQSHLARGMSTGELQELLGMFEVTTYLPAEWIQIEGESSLRLCVVLKGRCRITKKTKSGQEQELSVLEPHGIFGEMSFFNPAPHSASVQALTEVELAGIRRDRFDILTRVGSTAAQKLAFNMLAVLIERLRAMDAWIADRIEHSQAHQHQEEWLDFQRKLYTGWTF
ncbi:MAG: cyclic nucleotide-binding domain-containing protein [Planctomycetes bacterium]|nr:cyclic nucleotide-binding domain-containing protein [Planctomycetota bacterium]